MAMDVERLIECVKNQVFLYDLGHKDYKNTSRKAAIWEQIAEELNENSETVKLKWKTVRDGYIKYKKQQKDGNCKKVINYIWSSHLRFLDDYQVSRKSKTPSVNTTTNNTITTALQLSEDESETVSQSYSPASILIPSPSDSGPFRNESSPRRKRKDPEKSLGYLKTKKGKKEKENYDATDHLFLSYSETFKTFSPRQQALLKVELAKLFSNAELNALQNAENLQESFVAGSSPGYGLVKHDDGSILQDGQNVHTVDDDDTEDDEIEFVNPTQSRRSRRSRNVSDTTG